MNGLVLVLSALAVLAVTQSAVVQAPGSRASGNWGTVGVGDRLLSRQNLYKAAIVNAIQTQDYMFRGNATNSITAVQAMEVGVTQYGAPRIVAGGLRYNNVTVRITSAVGRGFNYQISVWGR